MNKVFTKELRKKLYHGEEEFTIPDGFNIIGSTAFQKCTNLKRIIIPSTIGLIRKMAFWKCTALEEVVENFPYRQSCTISDRAFACCTNLKSIPFCGSLGKIGEKAFYNCESLTMVSIKYGIQTISDGAFYGCTKLECINIPESVEYISWGAFAHCPNLRSVFIENMDCDITQSSFDRARNEKMIVYHDPVKNTYKQVNHIVRGGYYLITKKENCND